MPANEIYFYSIITALMTGLASPSTSQPMSSFLAHGTHGLGTFAHMDGEMVIVDGTAYQLRASGQLSRVSDDKRVSFGVVTPFAPSAEQTRQVQKRLVGLQDLQSHLDALVPGGSNHFVAFRLDGRFARVKVRAIHAQEYADEPLSELGKTQAVHEYSALDGCLVGFRSPAWSGGFTVPGLHVHFIDRDRTCGGHVLEMEVEEGAQVSAVRGCGVKIDLPEGEEFGMREIAVDEAGLKKVEG